MKVLIGTTVIIASAIGSHAQGCCSTPVDGTGHAEHAQTTASVPAKIARIELDLNGIAKPVFENYLIAQASLASDSLESISTSASALAQAIREDAAKTFPAAVAIQAESLAKAKDLATARKAFKPLSDSLIQYVQAGKIPKGILHEAYCPMAKAGWLQADKTVRNPYFGKSMLNCGQIKS